MKQRRAAIKEARADTEANIGKDAVTGRFLQGNSGNPAGRPRGSRNRLAQQFIDDLELEWKRSGSSALSKVAATNPEAFCKLVSITLPAKIDQSISIDINLLEQCQTYAQAFRVARNHIGADTLMIEGEISQAEVVGE